MHFILPQHYHIPIKQFRYHKDQTWAECVGLGVWHEGMWGVKRRATLQWHARWAVGICDRGQQGSRVMCKDYAPQILYSTPLVLDNSAKMYSLPNSTYLPWMWRNHGLLVYTGRWYWTKMWRQYAMHRKTITYLSDICPPHPEKAWPGGVLVPGHTVWTLLHPSPHSCHWNHQIISLFGIPISFFNLSVHSASATNISLPFPLPPPPDISSPEFIPEEVRVGPLVLHDGPVVVTIRNGIGGDAMLPHLTQHLHCQYGLGVEST